MCVWSLLQRVACAGCCWCRRCATAGCGSVLVMSAMSLEWKSWGVMSRLVLQCAVRVPSHEIFGTMRFVCCDVVLTEGQELLLPPPSAYAIWSRVPPRAQSGPVDKPSRNRTSSSKCESREPRTRLLEDYATYSDALVRRKTDPPNTPKHTARGVARRRKGRRGGASRAEREAGRGRSGFGSIARCVSCSRLDAHGRVEIFQIDLGAHPPLRVMLRLDSPM